MRHQHKLKARRLAAALLAASAPLFAHASDHLDTPSVIADPRADIGDLYAWMSPDHRRLELAMTIVGHSFSDQLRYVFHVESGKRFGETTKTQTIVCRLVDKEQMTCEAGRLHASSGGSKPSDRMRVFAGLRDDPFFNNVKGTRAAYNIAKAALDHGVTHDVSGCPAFDTATSTAIMDAWRHTDGGPGKNFLAGWTPASIVVSVDVGVVDAGGKTLAVWATTESATRQIDRVGRPLTGNALLGTIAPDDVSDKLKEEYNAATPQTAARFIPEIEHSLGFYDAFDGRCGNALLGDAKVEPDRRYRPLAALLADDRLWINAKSGTCKELFAVERAALAGETALRDDCGGRGPNVDAVNVWRSLLVNGTTSGVDDGVHRDEHEHSETAFPFFASPDKEGYR